MKVLVVKSHPYEKSFNHAIINTIKAASKDYEEIDLIKDGFNPVMTLEALDKWRKLEFPDALSEKYYNMLRNTELLVLPFPIWWGGMPAILKGFIDKVFLRTKVYDYDAQGHMVGTMKCLKAAIITTSEVENDIFNNVLGNPIEKQLMHITLGTCGIDVIKYYQIDRISSTSQAERAKHLDEIRAYFQSLP